MQNTMYLIKSTPEVAIYIDTTTYIIIYYPDKWRYNVLYFIDDLIKVKADS